MISLLSTSRFPSASPFHLSTFIISFRYILQKGTRPERPPTHRAVYRSLSTTYRRPDCPIQRYRGTNPASKRNSQRFRRRHDAIHLRVGEKGANRGLYRSNRRQQFQRWRTAFRHDRMDGRICVYAANLFRLLRLLGYGHRTWTNVRLPIPGKLQLPLSMQKRGRILAALAYFPWLMVSGLRLYPIGRQSSIQATLDAESFHRMDLDRHLAWRKLDLPVLGTLLLYVAAG